MKNENDEIKKAQKIIKSIFHARIRQNHLSFYVDYGRCLIRKKASSKMGLVPGLYVNLVILNKHCWLRFSKTGDGKLLMNAYCGSLYFFSKDIARKVMSLSNVPQKRIGRFRFKGNPVVEKDGTIWCRLEDNEVVDIYSISQKLQNMV